MTAPSVHAIRSALEQIEGAIRFDPSPEDIAAGTDLGTPILRFAGDEPKELTAARPGLIGDDEAPTVFEHPSVIFEVPPKLTDAEVFEALGEGLGELMRLAQIKGTDALGWYVTFHQRAVQYGIYLPVEGVTYLALAALANVPLPLERRLEIAFHAILRHELFHFEADCMAANWELSIGREVYWWADITCRALEGYKVLEEALANAYMLRGLRHPGGALRFSRGSYDALRKFCDLQPAGYRDGPHYAKSRQHYLDGCRILSANFEEARYKTIDDWEIPGGALDTLIFYPNPFQIDWRRCPVLLHDRLGLLKTLGIGVDFFETIVGVVELPSFLRALRKLGRAKEQLWERRKDDLARCASLSSLGLEAWPAGGADCYSVRLDGNYRVHLRRSRGDSPWVAESIGDHKAMGHG